MKKIILLLGIIISFTFCFSNLTYAQVESDAPDWYYKVVADISGLTIPYGTTVQCTFTFYDGGNPTTVYTNITYYSAGTFTFNSGFNTSTMISGWSYAIYGSFGRKIVEDYDYLTSMTQTVYPSLMWHLPD